MRAGDYVLYKGGAWQILVDVDDAEKWIHRDGAEPVLVGVDELEVIQ